MVPCTILRQDVVNVALTIYLLLLCDCALVTLSEADFRDIHAFDWHHVLEGRQTDIAHHRHTLLLVEVWLLI